MYSIQQYAATLYEVLQDTNPKDHQKVIDNFVSVLKENEDIAFFPNIVKEIEKIDRLRGEIKKVEITSAKPLDVAEERGIIEELNASIGENIELKKVVDEGIISGLVIKIDDMIIDGSVKKRIERLGSEII